MLKRHLMTAYGMTPEEYRARMGPEGGLPDGRAELRADASGAGQEDRARAQALRRRPSRRPSGRGRKRRPPEAAQLLRLDTDVFEKFRATGPGWQSSWDPSGAEECQGLMPSPQTCAKLSKNASSSASPRPWCAASSATSGSVRLTSVMRAQVMRAASCASAGKPRYRRLDRRRHRPGARRRDRLRLGDEARGRQPDEELPRGQLHRRAPRSQARRIGGDPLVRRQQRIRAATSRSRPRRRRGAPGSRRPAHRPRG